MKEEQESNLEETLIISIIAVLAVFFRFIIESDLSLTLIVYILIFSAIIIVFYMWAHFFTHAGIVESICQYSEHVLMGGTALTFLWIVFARRKREEIMSQKF